MSPRSGATGKMSLCRSCDKPILWVKTQHGKPMPLDGKKVVGGNIEVTDGVGYIVKSSEAERYVSHFVTCPNAVSHRKT